MAWIGRTGNGTTSWSPGNRQFIPRLWPGRFLADSTFATGGNLSNLAGRGIEAVMPVEQTKLPDENPAQRVNPTAPIAESDWPKLPRRAQTGKLDRSAFIYDAAKDCYYCPLVPFPLRYWHFANPV